jgi:hypothetical protein
MALWGAPWCHFCHENLPKVQAEWNRLSADQKEQIEFRVYVPTGRTQTSKPTQASTDAYVASLGLTANAVSDAGWMAFRSYVGNRFVIPAGSVIDARTGEVLRRYPGGTLDPIGIVNFATRVK